MRLGAHMSIEGGLARAVERAQEAGCQALQIFTKSSRQWNSRPLGAEQIGAFRDLLSKEGIGPVASHGSYLVNLASPEEALYRRSVGALGEEMQRCDALGIPLLVVHPGAHMGSGLQAGVRRIAAALDAVRADLPGARVRILLELWAGQGTTIGGRFEEIAAILERTGSPQSIGVCFDTCHAFAAGYDLRTGAAYEATMAAFERVLGLERLSAFHVNDSKTPLGARVDRHEHIGRGWIGLEAFRLLMNDERFESIPMYLETPKGPDLRADRENLATLRALKGERVARIWTPPAGGHVRPSKTDPGAQSGLPGVRE